MLKTHILILTNRDSDNLGDQLIEASVISLVHGVMRNLDIPRSEYSIESRAAGIISKKYMKTRDPSLLEGARSLISRADILIFGGSPLFNYSYQNFYLRTIKTLEIAEEFGVPVIFSSIGVEKFDPNNAKCVRLKKALALSCVRQITTRDDFASLEQYVEGTDTPIAHVADPVVLADIVFRKKPPAPKAPPAPAPMTIRSRVGTLVRRVPILDSLRVRVKETLLARGTDVPQPVTPTPTPKTALAPTPPRRKKIGLVVVRSGIFADNGIEFSEQEQQLFWLRTRAELIAQGYDVRLFTTGHYADEVFLDSLVRTHGIPSSQAAVVINSPEGLIGELKACDGVIAFRLHASITAFALGIPAVGLSWNQKVPDFYESIGYGERALASDRWSAEKVLPILKAAMRDGIKKDESFLSSVYVTLFEGMKGIVAPDANSKPYSLAELKSKLPRYGGTNARAYQVKARSKLRRAYTGIAAAPVVMSGKQYYLQYRQTLDVDRSIIFYETMDGERMNDNPFAIFEYLRSHPEYGAFTHVWSLKKTISIPAGYENDGDVVFVVRGSRKYHRYLATAGHLVFNVGVPDFFVRRPEQRYLNTWHGVPFKALGRDAARARFGAAPTISSFLKATHIVTPCAYMTSKLLSAYSMEGVATGALAETGYPRVDVTLKAGKEAKALLRDKLGLKTLIEGQRAEPVVLYAPTWRAENGKTQHNTDDIVRTLDVLSTLDAQIVFRGHHRVTRLVADQTIGEQSENVIVSPPGVSTNELLSVVDILITDYSSVFFDFLPTGKPIVHYLNDLDEYSASRGVYLQTEDLPGQVVQTTQELVEAVQTASDGLRVRGNDVDLQQNPIQGDRYKVAQERFAPHEDGNSTHRVVEFFWGTDSYAAPTRTANDGRPTKVYWAGRLGNDASSRHLLDDLTEACESDEYQVTLVIDQESRNSVSVMKRIKSLGSRLSVLPYDSSKQSLLPAEYERYNLFVARCLLDVEEIKQALETGEILRGVVQREYQRRLDDSSFDRVVVSSNLSAEELALAIQAGPVTQISRK